MNMTLRDWLEILRQEGNLSTVSREVDPVFELSAVGKKLDGKSAVLFKKVKGYDMPVVTGLAGSRDMFAKALATDRAGMIERFNHSLDNPMPCELVNNNGLAVKQNILKGSQINLAQLLPAPTHHAKDAGAFLTAAMLIAKDPETGEKNVAIHRHQILGPNKLGALLLPRHTLHMFNKAEAKGQPLEVALVIGVHPVLLLASQATTRFGIDELEIAGALMGEPVRVTKCETIDLEVPVEAEFILEGKMLPGVREAEGPFGEYPRCYGPESPKQIIEIQCVTYRNNPIYHTIVPATLEHLLLGAIPREAVMLQMVRQAVPSVKAVHLTPAGGCRYHAVISIDKKHEGQGKNAIFAALTSSTEVKHVVVVDSDIDIFDPQEVEWAISTRCQAAEDVFIIKNAMGNKLDPSSKDGVSDKMGIDATIPLADAVGKYEKITIPGLDAIKLDDYLD